MSMKQFVVKWFVKPYVKKVPLKIRKAIAVLVLAVIAFSATNLELSEPVREGLNAASEFVLELVPEAGEDVEVEE